LPKKKELLTGESPGSPQDEEGGDKRRGKGDTDKEVKRTWATVILTNGRKVTSGQRKISSQPKAKKTLNKKQTWEEELIDDQRKRGGIFITPGIGRCKKKESPKENI